MIRQLGKIGVRKQGLIILVVLYMKSEFEMTLERMKN